MISSVPPDSGSSIAPLVQYEKESLKEAVESGAAQGLLSQQGPASDQEQGSGDTVSISAEARELAEASGTRTAEDKKEEARVGTMPRPQGEEGSGSDPLQQIKEQIKEVQKKLQEAKARLAAVQSQDGQTDPAKQEGDPAEAAMRAALSALVGNAEAEAIQKEITMLTQQLLLLNNKLLEEAKKSGGSGGAAGTAGLGGAGDLGGLGERISVTA